MPCLAQPLSPPPAPALQEVWSSVGEKEEQVEQDAAALELAKTLLQRHADEAAEDDAPLK